jgi:hypothetical protein
MKFVIKKTQSSCGARNKANPFPLIQIQMVVTTHTTGTRPIYLYSLTNTHSKCPNTRQITGVFDSEFP